MDSKSQKSHSLKSSVIAVRSGLACLAAAQDDPQRHYLAGLLGLESTTLAEQCLQRNAWLNTAYDWIEQHKEDLEADDLKAREDRWLRNLRQYEVAMDLLGQTLEALKAIPRTAQPPAMSSGIDPHTQEAFL